MFSLTTTALLLVSAPWPGLGSLVHPLLHLGYPYSGFRSHLL